MPKTKKPQTLYSPHPGIAMVQKWIADLPERTGHSLDEWLTIITDKGPPTELERRVWLKDRHQFGTNNASWLAARSVGKLLEDSDPDLYLQTAERFVAEMFADKKAGLTPIYDALLKLGLGLASDVKACPCKTMVPLYRNHVFAQIKPASNTRIDMGFALKDAKLTGRLVDTGGFAKKDRITHRIPIKSVDEIDDEVAHWLRKAYVLDAR
jgi:Domain of unknown function (DUF5655)/Domain of unknown function (DUF4287)